MTTRPDRLQDGPALVREARVARAEAARLMALPDAQPAPVDTPARERIGRAIARHARPREDAS